MVLSNIAAILALVGALGGSQVIARPADVTAILARAEGVYYEARFNEAIAMLVPLNTALEAQPGRIQERIRIKLQLALAYIGLNQFAEAKARFSEIYEIDSQFTLDRSKFAAKVLTLYDEAKVGVEEKKCRVICERVDNARNASNPAVILGDVEGASECSCMAAKKASTVDNIFREAVEDYRRGDFSQALTKFRAVLKLNPQHSLAAQYVDLVHDNLQVSVDLIALRWRTQFDAREFSQASESYRQLLSANIDGTAALPVDQMQAQYRKLLTGMVQSWSQACKAKDTASMDRIWNEANQLLPDTSMAQDILGQMKNCVANPPPPLEAAAKPPAESEQIEECIENPETIAMMRLKKRIDPQLPAGRKGVVRVRATDRIDDQGNTTVRGLRGGTPVINRAIITAVQNWKFYPAKIDDHERCVETELQLVLKR